MYTAQSTRLEVYLMENEEGQHIDPYGDLQGIEINQGKWSHL